MSLEVRPLDPEDLDAAVRLGRLSFGGDLAAPVDPAAFDTPAHRVGAFDGGRLVGKLSVLDYAQWYAGRAVPMGGVGGVAVAPEDRAGGVAQQLLLSAIHRMREAGQGVSMLYPTAVGLYRSVGWELAGDLSWTRVRTESLARVPAPSTEVRLRRGTAADVGAVAACYSEVARTTTGLLTRDTPPFVAGVGEVLEHDVVTLAVEGEHVTGYTCYLRGQGYDEHSRLEVSDLIATTGSARAALLRQLGSWASVAPHVEVRLLADDADALLLPDALPAPCRVVRWMLRVVDLPTAVAARGWPSGLDVSVGLDVVDDQVPAHAGRQRLEVHDGSGSVERGGDASVRVHVRALSALYAGALSTAALVRAGLLDGPPPALEALDSAFAGPRPQCLDYF